MSNQFSLSNLYDLIPLRIPFLTNILTPHCPNTFSLSLSQYFLICLFLVISHHSTLHNTAQNREMQTDKFAKDSKKALNDEKKSFSCNQCNYTSDRSSRLKSHMLVHSGEKPFACTHCNYSAKQASHLKSHMLTHSGEKPFTCSQSDNSFS